MHQESSNLELGWRTYELNILAYHGLEHIFRLPNSRPFWTSSVHNLAESLLGKVLALHLTFKTSYWSAHFEFKRRSYGQNNKVTPCLSVLKHDGRLGMCFLNPLEEFWALDHATSLNEAPRSCHVSYHLSKSSSESRSLIFSPNSTRRLLRLAGDHYTCHLAL